MTNHNCTEWKNDYCVECGKGIFDYVEALQEQVKELIKGETKQKLVDIICQQKDENEELRIIKFVQFTDEECWIYQGDGEDHLESLVCPVVISPEGLLALVEQVKKLEVQIKYIKQCALPDPHDERSISLSWLCDKIKAMEVKE